jgi:hypothetical protein
MFKAVGNKAQLITEIIYADFGPQVTKFKNGFHLLITRFNAAPSSLPLFYRCPLTSTRIWVTVGSLECRIAIQLISST